MTGREITQPCWGCFSNVAHTPTWAEEKKKRRNPSAFKGFVPRSPPLFAVKVKRSSHADCARVPVDCVATKSQLTNRYGIHVRTSPYRRTGKADALFNNGIAKKPYVRRSNRKRTGKLGHSPIFLSFSDAREISIRNKLESPESRKDQRR